MEQPWHPPATGKDRELLERPTGEDRELLSPGPLKLPLLPPLIAGKVLQPQLPGTSSTAGGKPSKMELGWERPPDSSPLPAGKGRPEQLRGGKPFPWGSWGHSRWDSMGPCPAGVGEAVSCAPFVTPTWAPAEASDRDGSSRCRCSCPRPRRAPPPPCPAGTLSGLQDNP